MTLSVDEQHQCIIIDFGKSVTWFGLGAAEAVALAQKLLELARRLQGE